MKLSKKKNTKKTTKEDIVSLMIADGDDDFIDDDALLTEEDRVRPTVEKSDCSTKRKACKNCSCGRAEMEEKEIAAKKTNTAVQLSNPYLTDEQINNPQSACGSVRLHLSCMSSLDALF